MCVLYDRKQVTWRLAIQTCLDSYRERLDRIQDTKLLHCNLEGFDTVPVFTFDYSSWNKFKHV